MDDTQVTQMTQKDLGNTRPNPRGMRSRKWCFTLNNYSKEEIEHLQNIFDTNTQYVLGYEIGENGTPHIQGYVEFKNGVSFESMKKKIPRAHIEKTRGSTKQNFDYCSKDGNFDSNIEFLTFREKLAKKCLKSYENVVWKDWQQEILNIKNDNRTIHWYWDEKGNSGKSYIAKYLALTKKIVLCEGRKVDIFNQVNICIENETEPEFILCDIPRTNMDYINYGALEKLKDGLLYSGKYEGGICIFPPPIVVCLANEPPDESALSPDRWHIVNI